MGGSCRPTLCVRPLYYRLGEPMVLRVIILERVPSHHNRPQRAFRQGLQLTLASGETVTLQPCRPPARCLSFLTPYSRQQIGQSGLIWALEQLLGLRPFDLAIKAYEV